MLFIILFINIIKIVYGDLIKEPNYMKENDIPIDNIIASCLWAASVCSCVGLVCNHKKKIPIKIQPKEEYGKQLYEISVKNKDELNKLKDDLQDMKQIIKNLEKQQYDKLKYDGIPNNIIYKFGEGPIRFKKDDKYYHGLRIDDNKKNIEERLHTFKERIDGKEINKNYLITFNHINYCCNCSYDEKLSKRRKVYKIYKCNGHVIN